MARVSWSFNFTASPATEGDAFETACADAKAKAAAWLSEKLPVLGFSTSDAEGVAEDVKDGVEHAIAIAKRKGLGVSPITLKREGKFVQESFFVELVGRTGPDAASRHGGALGVFVSAPLPSSEG